MANIAALPVLLKELKLASIAKQWELLAQKALDEQWLPQQYLVELCEQEAAERYQKRLQRYLREAQLPPGKQLASFDFTAAEGIQQNQLTALIQQPQWVKRAENILLFGASGVGKTHLACAIGYGLLERERSLSFQNIVHHSLCICTDIFHHYFLCYIVSKAYLTGYHTDYICFEKCQFAYRIPVSYTHLTLPTTSRV